MFNLAILGPQASGKGTQARLIKEKFNLFYLEMGSCLREIAKQKTSLGEKVNQIVNQEGRLVPDEVIEMIIRDQLGQAKKNQGILFDGFPRIVSQIPIMDQLLKEQERKLNLVIYLKIPEELVFQRISGRRVCERCGLIFNLTELTEQDKQKCRACGGKLITRKDDQPAKIKERLRTFKQNTLPVIDFYRQQKMLFEVDGSKSVVAVAGEIEKFLKKRMHDFD
jgi:adenylate kinase